MFALKSLEITQKRPKHLPAPRKIKDDLIFLDIIGNICMTKRAQLNAASWDWLCSVSAVNYKAKLREIMCKKIPLKMY